MDVALSDDAVAELGLADAGDLAAEADKRRMEGMLKRYPQPEKGDILALYERQRKLWGQWRNMVEKEHERRYLQDRLPDKWQKNLKDGRRIFSRLSHNEINRRVSAQTRNPPRITIMPKGTTEKALSAAAHETRWCNQLMRALNRKNRGFRRQFVDNQYEAGISAYEIFLTDDYDSLDTKRRMVRDSKTGIEREETAAEANRRLDADLMGLMPIGIRAVNSMSFYVDRDRDGICAALIVEKKPWRHVVAEAARAGVELKDDPKTPRPNDPGVPANTSTASPQWDMVETVRYYDRVWMAWMVNGHVIGKVEQHRLPGVPVILGYGLTTSSANMDEAYQGVCWGLDSIERAINDQLTLAHDVSFTYSRPHWIVETAPGSTTIPDEANASRPKVLDMSDPSKVIQLNPGQVIKNSLEGWQPFVALPLLQVDFDIWQRNGANPITQGESPGAATAGYTANLYTQNSETLYEDFVEDEANTWGEVCDFVRQMIKHSLRERVFLDVPGIGDAKGTIEWLALGPDDISDAPAICEIDPTSAANKIAKRQSLMDGNAGGFVSKRRAQEEGFDIEDPQAETEEVYIERGLDQMFPQIVQMAQETARAALQPPPAPPPPGAGGPAPQQVVDPNAPPPAPPISAADNAASNGTGFLPGPDGNLNPAVADAGQGGTYVPGNAVV